MLALFHHADGFWMREKEDIGGEEDTPVDEDFFMTVEDIGDAVFNSRGPRSIYRGLEEVEEYAIWDEEEKEYWKSGNIFWKYLDFLATPSKMEIRIVIFQARA